MKIVVVGTGYVGLTTAVALAHIGNKVVCFDSDKGKIEELSHAKLSIKEQGLEPMLLESIGKGNILFTNNLSNALNGAEIIFNAIVTPIRIDGSADSSPILQFAKKIGSEITSPLIYVSKSTVPIGTTAQVKTIVDERLRKRGVKTSFEVISSPEFLREGTALDSFFNPDKIVIGATSEKASSVILKLLSPTIKEGTKVIKTSIEAAELAKLSSNMLLATRISYMNTIANICDEIRADFKEVHAAMFAGATMPLYAGVGYSGACFPKDVRTLISSIKEMGADATLLSAVENVNNSQKRLLFDKFCKQYTTDISNKRVAIWGVSAKVGTEDFENTAAEEIIKLLTAKGVAVSICDFISPSKIENKYASYNINITDNIYESARGADAIILLTDYAQFKNPDWERIKELMREPYILDGKNIYDRDELGQIGFKYEGVGR